MRIPKFAFALLVSLVIGLASSLAVMRVGAHSNGSVLALKAVAPNGHPYSCTIDTSRKRPQSCEVIGRMDASMAGFRFEVLDREDDRVRLGFRSKTIPFPSDGHGHMDLAEVMNQPQSEYWFEPGHALKVEWQGVGFLNVTGEWMDHMPAAMGEPMDPNVGELRLVSPILLRGKEVLADMQGGTATAVDPGDVVAVYFRPLGRYLLSLQPLKGAVQGTVRLNRISFDLKGQENIFICGTPVTRGHSVWVLYEPDFKPVDNKEQGSVGAGQASMIAPEAVLSNPASVP